MTKEAFCRYCKDDGICQLRGILESPTQVAAIHTSQQGFFEADKCPKIEEAVSLLNLEDKKP